MEGSDSILAFILPLLLALPLVFAVTGVNIRLVVPRGTVLFIAAPFVGPVSSVRFRAEACGYLAVESAVPLGVALGADLGPCAEYLGLGSVLVAGMAGRAVYEEQTRGW